MSTQPDPKAGVEMTDAEYATFCGATRRVEIETVDDLREGDRVVRMPTPFSAPVVERVVPPLTLGERIRITADGPDVPSATKSALALLATDADTLTRVGEKLVAERCDLGHEPEVKPGTAGTATILEDPHDEPREERGMIDGVGDLLYITPSGYNVAARRAIQRFVPDEDAKALRAELATAQARLDGMTRHRDLRERERDQAGAEVERLTTAANAAKARALRAERDARAGHAEVERWKGEALKAQEEYSDLVVDLRDMREPDGLAMRTSAGARMSRWLDGLRGTKEAHNPAQDGPGDVPAGDGGSEGATGAPEGVSDGAVPTPDREAVVKTLRGVFPAPGPAWIDRAADAVLALLRGESRG